MVGAATFRVVMPGYVPPGLTLRQIGHMLGRQGGQGGLIESLELPPPCPAGSVHMSCSAWWPSGQPAVPRWLAPLEAKGIEAVWLTYAGTSAASGYLYVVEWAASTYVTRAPGAPIHVAGTRATISTQGDNTVVTLVRSGTVVLIRTNRGRVQALKVAASPGR